MKGNLIQITKRIILNGYICKDVGMKWLGHICKDVGMKWLGHICKDVGMKCMWIEIFH